jgi:hypothetical protein
MSLFCPPAGFPVHLAVFWPFIWAQILMLRAWVRAAYGKGTLYRWSVTPHGRVFLTSIEWIPGAEAPAPVLAGLAARAHARIAALTDGRLAGPCETARSLSAPSGAGPAAQPCCPALAARCAAPWPAGHLPLPDI